MYRSLLEIVMDLIVRYHLTGSQTRTAYKIAESLRLKG